eukprot:scaffold13882_cov90-Isochrysis_galbana.AAC.1
MVPALGVVVQLSRVHVQVSQDDHRELIRTRQLALILLAQAVLVKVCALVDFLNHAAESGARGRRGEGCAGRPPERPVGPVHSRRYPRQRAARH